MTLFLQRLQVEFDRFLDELHGFGLCLAPGNTPWKIGLSVVNAKAPAPRNTAPGVARLTPALFGFFSRG